MIKKKWPLLLFLVLLLFFAGTWLIKTPLSAWLTKKSGNDGDSGNLNGTSEAVSLDTKGRPSSGRLGYMDKRLAPIYAGDILPVQPSQLGKYFEDRGRKVETLLAAFGATRDQQFLEEMFKSYPGDRRTLDAILLWSDNNEYKQEAAKLIEANFPQNGLPTLFKAKSIDFKDKTAADNYFKDVSEKTQVSLGALNDPHENYELALSLVDDPVKAWAYSKLFFLSEGDARATYMSRISTLADATGSLLAPEEKDKSSVAVAQMMYSTMASYDSNLGPGSTLEFLNSEKDVLNKLDPTIGFGEDDTTIGDRVKEIDQQIKDAQQREIQYDKFFRESSPDVISEYVDTWRNQGDAAANALIYKP